MANCALHRAQGAGFGLVSAPDPHVTPARKRVWYHGVTQSDRGNYIHVVPYGTRMRGPADRIYTTQIVTESHDCQVVHVHMLTQHNQEIRR